ncbi:MAG: WecB/TagA/CpsF family glycosyltransferase, partial [Spirochaetota bacterium]
RSGDWFNRYGLEWLPRLLKEPGRLWNRTLISAPKFMYYIVKERILRLPLQ